MIQASNIAKAYGRQVLFDKAGFTINPGERVGLVGRNGSGKTTLFRLILKEELPDSGAIGIPNGYAIGHLSQHIRFTENTVLREGCLSLKRAENGTNETYKVETILFGLGFSADDLDRHPSELSGGYQLRLSLAKALIAEPNLLLLDEPTNYLDIVSVRWLERFLVGWKNELIIITHDRSFMDSITTHTMGIYCCKIRKFAGSTDKLYQQILLEEEVHEKTRINDEKRQKEIEQFINRFRAQANKARAVQSRIKALQKKDWLEKLPAIKTLDFEFNAAPFSGKCLLSVENVSFSFDPHGPLMIDHLSFTVGKKDRIAIIGKNGVGKTTLLNLLTGELNPLTGSITPHPSARMGYFGQSNIDRLDTQKTVEGEILETHPDNNRKAARTICGIMMFEGDQALKKISVLSGGEKSRVLLGKLLVSPSNVLLLDEPTNHLDMESIDSLLEAIDAFQGAVIIVTHSEMILNAIATRLIVFDDGKVKAFEGTYQDFLERVGWKNESKTADADNTTEGRGRSSNRKEERRLRAEIISGRARTLRALEKKITGIENTIMSLEKEVERDTRGLVKASQRGEWQSIQRLSKAIHESKLKIDELFAELENLTTEYGSKAKEFEERLKNSVVKVSALYS